VNLRKAVFVNISLLYRVFRCISRFLSRWVHGFRKGF